MKRAVIMGGADILDYSFYISRETDFVICADGGYKHALALGITPDVLLGDFDSILSPLPENVETHAYPPEKDKTDLQIAVEYAIDNGFSNIYTIGVFGGRTDHFLGNMGLMLYAHQKGCKAVMEDADTWMCLLSGELRLEKHDKYFLSVIPVYEDVCVSIQGVKYPLQNTRICRGDTLGISNEIIEEEAYIKISDGSAIVLLAR